MAKTNKSQVIAVTLYPTDREILKRVMESYGCNRSQAMRIAIRGYGRMSDVAIARHITVQELADDIIFSSFARDGG